MKAILTFLVVSVAHRLALPASCPFVSGLLSFTSTSSNLTVPLNTTSLINTKDLSANSTASGLYAPGQVRTEFCDVAVLIPFRNEADVDAVIAAATLDNLRHRGDESMSKVAYHSGPGGGRDVILNFEPVHQQAAHMTWGMWHSALGDITAYYDREGKIPIKFYVLLSELSKSVTIGRGLLIQDIPHEGDEDSVMEEVA